MSLRQGFPYMPSAVWLSTLIIGGDTAKVEPEAIKVTSGDITSDFKWHIFIMGILFSLCHWKIWSSLRLLCDMKDQFYCLCNVQNQAPYFGYSSQNWLDQITFSCDKEGHWHAKLFKKCLERNTDSVGWNQNWIQQYQIHGIRWITLRSWHEIWPCMENLKTSSSNEAGYSNLATRSINTYTDATASQLWLLSSSEWP